MGLTIRVWGVKQRSPSNVDCRSWSTLMSSLVRRSHISTHLIGLGPEQGGRLLTSYLGCHTLSGEKFSKIFPKLKQQRICLKAVRWVFLWTICSYWWFAPQHNETRANRMPIICNKIKFILSILYSLSWVWSISNWQIKSSRRSGSETEFIYRAFIILLHFEWKGYVKKLIQAMNTWWVFLRITIQVEKYSL